MTQDDRGTKRKSKLREYVEIVVTAVILALIVRALIIQSYHIPSESMEDTLLKGDFLFANKFIFGAKRCIAVEGQTVELRGKRLYIDGVEKPESYAKYRDGDLQRSDYGPHTIPKGFILVLGDNRDNSYDSRFWGPLDKKLLRGKALFLYFSLDYKKHWIRFARIGDLIR
jgi:signal peptidase I